MAQVAGAKRAHERPAQAARHVGWSSGSAAAAASARSVLVFRIFVWHYPRVCRSNQAYNSGSEYAGIVDAWPTDEGQPGGVGASS